MKFNYYYGSQADQFNFVRIPKVLLTEKTFAALSYPAKMMYGVLLDRMSLSRKNGWFDEQNRVFIIYQIGELQKDFGFSKKKAIDILEELEDFGLLEKKRRGHGLPNILYVKSFMDGVAQAGDSASENPAAAARQKKRYSRSASPGTSGMVGVGTSGLTGTAGLFRSDGHAAGKIRSNNEGSSIGKPCVGCPCIGKSNAGRTGTGEFCVRSSDRGNSAPAQSSPESMVEAADSEQATLDTGDSPFGNKDLRCSDGENSAVSKEFTPESASNALETSPEAGFSLPEASETPDTDVPGSALQEAQEGQEVPEWGFQEVSEPELQEMPEWALQEVPEPGLQEVPKLALQEVPESELQEVPKSEPLKSTTERSHADWSQIKSNQILSAQVGVWGGSAPQARLPLPASPDEMGFDETRSEGYPAIVAQKYRELICENIEFPNLLLDHPQDKEFLEGIVDLMQETVLCQSDKILIASNYYPAELVKMKFLKLDYSHIQYVLDRFKANTTKVWNIKKYLLAALFNAPSTIDGYYTAEVNHDLAHSFNKAT